MINDYHKQLFREKTSIINELKASEKILLELTARKQKFLEIKSLNIKLETNKPEPIKVELSEFIGLSQFRKELKKQLGNQVENLSSHEKGKFSEREFQRKILKQIYNMKAVENSSQHEMDRRFIYFWNSENVINSPEVIKLQKNIELASFEHQANYRRYVKDGVQFALESLNYEISVRTLFPDMDSIYNWNFTAANFQSIKVMEDPNYFEDKHHITHQINTRSISNFSYVHMVGRKEFHSESRGWPIQSKAVKNKQLLKTNQVMGFKNVTGFKDLFHGTSADQTKTNKYATFMTELYSKFDKSIDENPQTQRNFDGSVDESIIRDLCMSFKRSIEELAAKYNITNYLKPHFIVICVAFASFNMLLRRLIQNSHQLSKKNDPVKPFYKDFCKKLFFLKLKRAQNDEISVRTLFPDMDSF